MTVHIYHEDILSNGFCDDCPRCKELAKDIIFLADSGIFMKYWEMTLRFLERGGGYSECNSELDKDVVRLLEDHIDKQKRIEERLAYVS